jgi:hypothetical protein
MGAIVSYTGAVTKRCASENEVFDMWICMQQSPLACSWWWRPGSRIQVQVQIPIPSASKHSRVYFRGRLLSSIAGRVNHVHVYAPARDDQC